MHIAIRRQPLFNFEFYSTIYTIINIKISSEIILLFNV